MNLRRTISISLAAALLLGAAAAGAEPNAADRENARRLMAEGRKKRDANDLARALQAFQAADALMHVPTTGLELAKTLAQMGRLAEAREKALAVVRTPETDGEPKAAPKRGGMPTWGWIGFGVGAAGLATSGVTTLLALSHKSAATDHCVDGKCPPQTYGDLDSAQTFATVSTVAFIVGVAGVGV